MERRDIKITLARKDAQLKQILALQAENVRAAVDAETAAEQGFLTAQHDLPLLKAMNAEAASVIAVHERRVVGYALAMTRTFGQSVPVLAELFDRQDKIEHRGQLLGESGYLVMGQICVAEAARGQRVPDRMYKYLRTCYYQRFPYLLTAIVAQNTRSLRVHQRVGFEELQRFTSADGHDWVLVIWNWADGMED